MSVIIGSKYEDQALSFLQQHGLKLVVRNFRYRYGEIDLILLDNDLLVFTEVRFRQPNDYAMGLESITPYKQQSIIKTAQLFLLKNYSYQNHQCRFDVIAISRYDNKTKIHWLKNAFQIN